MVLVEQFWFGPAKIRRHPVARIVLVADDSPTIQKRAIGILKGEGFEVETVSNGVAAIRRLAVLHPVVVLADVSMPGRDGYEVCDFIKRSPELSQVPVLLVASDMEPYDSARGAQVRADGIITKPFEAPELISMVVQFAERFEAATTPIPILSETSSAPLERTHESTAFGEEPDNTPTVVQHIEPDFSAAAGGMAFDQHSGEESTPPEPVQDESSATHASPPLEFDRFADSAGQTQDLPAGEFLWEADLSNAPVPVEPPPPSPDQGPFFVGGPEAATPDPVFLEEQPVQYSEHSHHHSAEPGTMIFGTPAEIAEPMGRDDSVASEPSPALENLAAGEPPSAAQAPSQSPEMATEQPVEPALLAAAAVMAKSLDSFSLDDAATGQVRFASAAAGVAQPEVEYAAPTEPAPVTEFAPPESITETVQTETPRPEVAPEEVYEEPAPTESLTEAVPADVTPAEAAAEVAQPEVEYEAPAEPAPVAEFAAPESIMETVQTETPRPEVAPEEVYAEAVPIEVSPEATPADAPPAEPADPEAVYAEAASPELPPDTGYTEIAAPEIAPEAVQSETVLVEPESSLSQSEVTRIEPMPPANDAETTFAPPTEVPSPYPEAAPEPALPESAPVAATLDWELFCTIVRKAVVKMSPAILPEEVVNDLAQRLADEIATEITSGSSRPARS
jgi:CheY-like chemotaxis protein